MTWHVDAGERSRSVDVRRANGRFVVVLDGREHMVDVIQVNGIWSLLIRKPSDEGQAGADTESAPAEAMRSYEVSFSGASEGTMIVRVSGRPVTVRLASSSARAARRREDERASGTQRIVAPMPGKIVKVMVKAGDIVTARQGLVVVEAMKMENELRASSSGTVSEVLVKEGSSVEAGAILVIVD